MEDHHNCKIECILTEKVHDSCLAIDEKSSKLVINNWSISGLKVGDLVICQLDQKGVSCTELSRSFLGDGFFSFQIMVLVPMVISNPNNLSQQVDLIFNYVKQIKLRASDETTLNCRASRLLFCNALVTEINVVNGEITVNCRIKVALEVKSISEVQLLVPSYGICEPKPCQEITNDCIQSIDLDQEDNLLGEAEVEAHNNQI